MKWISRKHISPLIQLLVSVIAAVALSLLVIIPGLSPPVEDVTALVKYMFGSGLVTIILAYGLYKQRILQRFFTLRWSLFSIIALTVFLIFFNVWVTARLMFITPHDLILTTALLIFAGLIAAVSSLFVAATLRERIQDLCDGVEQLAKADWRIRLPVKGQDELSHLAGMFNYMAARLQEIDDEKRALEQARRDMIAWVSHDLRTPLAAMRAMNEAMMDGVVADEVTVRRYRENIHSEIQHLSHMIDDLFALAQLDTGQLVLQKQMISLHDMVSDTMSSMGARARSQSVALAADVDPTASTVYAAPDKMQRILYNLFDNALRYTPEHGKVTLKARTVGTQIEISIHNTDSHIDAADLPHIFQSFYRGEEARSKDRGLRGTGLGLAIVRGFVEAHGGSIRVESERKLGTTFKLTLPAHP